jgi:hypothetical protein
MSDRGSTDKMRVVTGTTKVALTALLFAVALVTVLISAAVHNALPLFFAWAPLIGVGWVLSRPAPND